MATLSLSRPINLPPAVAAKTETGRQRKRAAVGPPPPANAERVVPRPLDPERRGVHPSADPETIAWNQRREAEWHAARPEAESTVPRTPEPERRIVHQLASPEIVAENRRREAEWLAMRAEAQQAGAAARAAAEALETTLRDLAPLAFTDPPVPLAIGIHRDIAALLDSEADKATISQFLRRWTRSTEYLRAIARGDPRRSLDGNRTGEPTADQRESAAKWLAARGVPFRGQV